MGLFDIFFKSTKTETKRYLTDSEIERNNKEFVLKFERVKDLFIKSLSFYNSLFCQCAYPRYQQIIGIDCTVTGNSFKCFETDLLLSLSKDNFDVTKSTLNDEVTNEKWICKKCGSTYMYGWSDCTIHVVRQKLKLTNLKTKVVGLPVSKPIQLCLGLAGHFYPSKHEIMSVPFEEFEKYISEK